MPKGALGIAPLGSGFSTRVRVKFSDSIDMDPRFRRCWHTVTDPGSSMGDVLNAVSQKYLFGWQPKEDLMFYLKGFAVHPEEKLTTFLRPDDLLEVRVVSSVRADISSRRGSFEIVTSGNAAVEQTRSVTVQTNEAALIDGISNRKRKLASAGIESSCCADPSDNAKKMLFLMRNTESEGRIDNAKKKTCLNKSQSESLGDPNFSSKNSSKSNIPEQTLPTKHIRFEDIDEIQHFTSVPSNLGAKQKLPVSTLLTENIQSSISIKSTPSWISNRLLSLDNSNVFTSSAPPTISSDEPPSSACLREPFKYMNDVGMDRQFVDFRKKPYSIIASLKSPVSDCYEQDAHCNVPVVPASFRPQAGDVIMYKTIALCEATWKVEMSHAIKAMVTSVGELKNDQPDLELAVLDEKDACTSTLSINWGSMVEVKLIAGPSVISTSEPISDTARNGTDGNSLLDIFQKDISDKRSLVEK